MSVQSNYISELPQPVRYYLKWGIPIFPVNHKKKPLTEHGFYNATTDVEQIQTWVKSHPHGWAFPTGKVSGIVVVDVDNKKGRNGFPLWDSLQEQNGAVKTLTAKTPNGGVHYLFRYPNHGSKVSTTTDRPGEGIDIRGDGGYAVIYDFSQPPHELEIVQLPEWFLPLLKTPKPESKLEPAKPDRTPIELAMEIAQAISLMNAMKYERFDDYEMWRNLGFGLHHWLGDAGLPIWDDASKRCPEKYTPGKCAEMWQTFREKENNVTKGSLIYWAEQDNCAQFIRPAKKGTTTVDYANALMAHGYSFRLNEMNDQIYVNGVLLTDPLKGRLEFSLRAYGYKNSKDTEVAMLRHASDNQFHPIKDYLTYLKWDGRDHIMAIGKYIADEHGMFPTLLRKWLIGAVGRILGRPGQQHPVLVLDGAQGVGKSFFVRWLSSPLPEYHIESPINTQDKDFAIRACSKFVWEVQELETTIRRQDLGSLKAFLSDEVVTVRKPYGHYDIVKPYTASFIGTVNNIGGFLNDPTGNRRYRVCALKSIDRKYPENIDINQLWAQAVTLFQSGETWELEEPAEKKMQEINAEYEVPRHLEFAISQNFNIEPTDKSHFTATHQIVKRLRALGEIRDGSKDKQLFMLVAQILTRMGCKNGKGYVNGKQERGWFGIWWDDPQDEPKEVENE